MNYRYSRNVLRKSCTSICGFFDIKRQRHSRNTKNPGWFDDSQINTTSFSQILQRLLCQCIKPTRVPALWECAIALLILGINIFLSVA
jgi:hypothetical protein